MTDPSKRGRVLELEVHLPADPELVSRMLSDPAELARWFAPFVEGSGLVGETLSLGWGAEMSWQTRLAALTPGKRVRWEDPPAETPEGGPSPGMVVEWLLAAEAGGTRLRLVQSGFGDGAAWDDQFDAMREGWRFFLWHLGETLAHHRGEPRRMVWTRRRTTLSRDALGARLFGPQGLALTPGQPESGSSARVRLGGREQAFEVVHAGLPGHLWGRCPELGGAVLMVEMEPCQEGRFHTGLWLSTWRLDPGEMARLQGELDRMADVVFGRAP